MCSRRPDSHSFARSVGLPALGAALALTAPGAASADDAMQVTVRGASDVAFSSVISADDSLREPVSAASLLAASPGVAVRRLGVDGSFATLSIRGSASTQVGVMLGRIPLTSGADPSFDVGSLPLVPGSSLRVYRGFAPASTGTSGYLGGVLVIDPPSTALGERTEWWTLGGSLGSLKVRAGDVRRVGDVTVATGLFASRTDGSFAYPREDPRTGERLEVPRENGGVVAAGGLSRVTLERPWGTVSALVLADERRQGLAGSSDAPTRFTELETSRLVAGVDAIFRTGGSGALHFAGYGRRERAEVDDPKHELGFGGAFRAVQKITSSGGSLGYRGRVGSRVWGDVFVDARVETLTPESPIVGTPDDARRNAVGLGAELGARPMGRRPLASSFRFDARADEARGTPGFGQPAFGEAQAFAPSGHFGAEFELAPNLSLAGHAGSLERPPGFVELFGARGVLVGDPALRPERATSADLGVRTSVHDGDVRVDVEAVGFATSATDLIAFVPAGVRTLRAHNIDRASIWGAEATIVLVAPHIRSRLAYTALRARNEAESGVEAQKPLPGRAPHDLVYDVVYSFGPVRLRYGLDAVAGTTLDTAGAIALPPRVFHGIGASYQTVVSARAGLSFGLQVDNLLDERALHVAADSPVSARPALLPASDLVGYPLPGRTVWFTARLTAE